MLDEGPAQCHIEQLHATTDAQHGPVGAKRRLQERNLPAITLRIAAGGRFVGYLAIECRGKVGPAGDDQSIDKLQAFTRLDHQWRNDEREAAGSLHKIDKLLPARHMRTNAQRSWHLTVHANNRDAWTILRHRCPPLTGAPALAHVRSPWKEHRAASAPAQALPVDARRRGPGPQRMRQTPRSSAQALCVSASRYPQSQH